MRPSRSNSAVVAMLAGAGEASEDGFLRVVAVTLPWASRVNSTVPPWWSSVEAVSPRAFLHSVEFWLRALVVLVLKPSLANVVALPSGPVTLVMRPRMS